MISSIWCDLPWPSASCVALIYKAFQSTVSLFLATRSRSFYYTLFQNWSFIELFTPSAGPQTPLAGPWTPPAGPQIPRAGP